MCYVHARWSVSASCGLHSGLNSGMGRMRQVTFCQRAKQPSETILVVCIDLIRSTRMVHALAPRAEPKQLGRPSDKISGTGGRCKCSCCAAAVLPAMNLQRCTLWPAWVEALSLASVGLQLSPRMHTALTGQGDRARFGAWSRAHRGEPSLCTRCNECRVCVLLWMSDCRPSTSCGWHSPCCDACCVVIGPCGMVVLFGPWWHCRTGIVAFGCHGSMRITSQSVVRPSSAGQVSNSQQTASLTPAQLMPQASAALPTDRAAVPQPYSSILALTAGVLAVVAGPVACHSRASAGMHHA
jgi:hypothetical protein